ncbi:WD40 repeat-like protein [Exidia glandulosa HHB12029]|uniref:WD40 repeat-like protein n=1 Tax=Exidia glandulosa HHB12029 TaxID=1314781 RepID=A0A165KFV4_EXIGL|nr:WD40 repeat-like protein [Exidia glandulosa HHB12029]
MLLAFWEPINEDWKETSKSALAFSPPLSQLRSTSGNRPVDILLGCSESWDVYERTISAHSAEISSVDLSQDGSQLLTSSRDGTIKLWDAATGTLICDTTAGICVATLTGHDHAVMGLAYASDSMILASCSDDQTVRLWDMRRYECREIICVGSEALCIAFSSDGCLLGCGTQDGTVYVWNNLEQQPVQVWIRPNHDAQIVCDDHTTSVINLAFAASDTRLLSLSSDGWIRKWNVADGNCLWAYKDHEKITALAVFPSRSHFATGSEDGAVQLWRLDECVSEYSLRGHSDTIIALAVDPTESRVASGSVDHTVRVWDLDQPQRQAQVLSGLMDDAAAVAFSSHGKFIVAGTHDFEVMVWNVATGDNRGFHDARFLAVF